MSGHECGIYAIVNRVNGNKYVGSSKDVLVRWTRHKDELRRGKHHSKHLQHAWNKYGQDSFAVELLVGNILPELLLDAEQYYLDKLRPAYNVAIDAKAPTRGRKMAPDTKANLIARLKGHPVTTETREKIRRAHLGMKASPETRAKIGAASRSRSPETIEKIRQAALRQKRREKWIPSPETRAIWSAQRRGRKASEQQLAKMRESQQARRAREAAA